MKKLSTNGVAEKFCNHPLVTQNGKITTDWYPRMRGGVVPCIKERGEEKR